MVAYDATLVQKYARRLHRSAAQLVMVYSVGGVLTGASMGLISRDVRMAGAAAILVGVLGYFMGREKAFRLKLEAQLALCQVEIEKHTRRSAPPR